MDLLDPVLLSTKFHLGGKHVALADGGANGSIIGLDMKIIYFNNDGKCVCIGIAGDHQLTGNRLCCGCSVTKSSVGWIKLMWPQGAQVKTQQNSILSIVQIQDNGCFINDVAIQHGGKQMIMTPNGVLLPLIIQIGLMYLEHYYPTARQMTEIDREEFMTAKTEWDPSKLNDTEGSAERHLQQFHPTPIDDNDSFYDSQGNIRVNKNDLNISDASNISGGNKREGYHSKPEEEYRPKPRKEKKRKKGNWVNKKKVKWKDQTKAPSFPTQLQHSPKSDPPIKGVPTAVAAELQAYVH